MVRAYAPVRSGAGQDADDDFDDEEEERDEDIDEIGYAACAWGGSASTPLLCQDEDDAEDEQRGGSSGSSSVPRWMRSIVKKKPKGFCPLCGEKVRSGAHVCAHAQGRVREAAMADGERKVGNAAFRAGRFEEALAAYTRALHHTPDDAALWSNRAAARTAMREEPGLSKAAVADCDETIRLAPSWPKGYFRKARLYELNEDWALAAETYGLALAHCHGAQEITRLKRALSNARTRVGYLERYRALPAAYAEACIHSRWLQLREAGAESVTRGEECDRRILEAEGDKAAGNAEVARQAWQQAAVCYTRGLRRLRSWCPADSPADAQCRLEVALMLNLALSEFHMGNYEAAAMHCTDALKLDSCNVKAWMRRAVALGEREEYDSALDDVEMALLMCPGEATLVELRHLRRRLRLRRQTLRRRQKAQATRMLSGTGL